MEKLLRKEPFATKRAPKLRREGDCDCTSQRASARKGTTGVSNAPADDGGERALDSADLALELDTAKARYVELQKLLLDEYDVIVVHGKDGFPKAVKARPVDENPLGSQGE